MKYCPECASKLEDKVIDGKSRKFCGNNHCQFVDWGNPTPVVAALVRNNGKYIIARNAAWPDGIFSVITGYLESDESVEAAVLREVKEELDLDGEIDRFLGHFIFKQKNQLIIAYEVKASGDVQLNQELIEFKTLTKDQLLEYNFHPLYVTEAIIKSWAE